MSGYLVNGHTMARAADVARDLGATLSVQGNVFTLSRNGQTVTWSSGSSRFSCDVSYTIADPAGGTAVPFHLSWSGDAGEPATIVGGQPYVRLATAAHALGALLVLYNTGVTPARAEVYDFRVNRVSPLADGNVYVTGGQWLTGWDSQAGTYVSPHYRQDRAGVANIGVRLAGSRPVSPGRYLAPI